uniref:Gastrin-releasing peptide n=1 Tax=Felis catus TaxID=9685 RepID=A0ABI7XZ20_FELCA
MRRRQLPLVLLALVLCQAPRGPAAPLPAGTGTALDKMYPRGNHWAVGHLMGKKSTRESPYVYEGGRLKQQLQYILWEEAARNLLSLMGGKGTGNYQPPQRELLAIRQSPWDSQDGSAFKVVERGRPRIRSRLQALSCQHRAQPEARTHEPSDHDLSRSWTLNRRSHPAGGLSSRFST